MLPGKRALFLLPLILFFSLVAPELVERSMYNDGVAYAGLAKNLAHGYGTFWTPRLTEIEYVAFHEHPPLVFGLQSLFFRVLGDGLATERVYAFTIFALSAGLLVLLWREALRELPEARRFWFVPLTLWLANEVVYHFYPANVLEPTVGLFSLAAVWCCLRSTRAGTQVQYLLAITTGLLLFAGSLCKGFVGLFPLGFFAVYWLVLRRLSLGRTVALTLVMTAALAAGYAVLWSFDAARESLTTYFEQQVLGSLSGERTYDQHMRDDRWYIIRRTFELLLPAVLLTGLVIGVAYRKLGRTLLRGPHMHYALLFLTLGVLASFPLAISPKQSFYYLLPSMGYYALGFALLLAPAFPPYFARTLSPARQRWFTGIMVALLLLGVVYTARHWGQSNRRDREKLADIDAMTTVIPYGATVGSAGDMRPLNVYMWRLHEVSIDTAVARRGQYEYLIAPVDTVVAGRQRVPVKLTGWGLWR